MTFVPLARPYRSLHEQLQIEPELAGFVKGVGVFFPCSIKADRLRIARWRLEAVIRDLVRTQIGGGS